MTDERTPILNLPLPHYQNTLEVDVERLRKAILGVDTAVGDLRTALGEISMDWASLTGKPESFPPTLHKATHSTGGADALTPADIGAQPAGDYALVSDARFTDARTPTAHAVSHKHGGTDEIATATPSANAIPKSGDTGKLDAGWMPAASTTTSGTVKPDGTTLVVNADGTLSAVARYA